MIVDLIKGLGLTAESASQFTLEGAQHPLLVLVKGILSAQCKKVISVYHKRNSPAGVSERARRRQALDETKVEENLSVGLLPNGTRIPGAIHAALQSPGKLLSKPKLGREAHVQLSAGATVEVGFADIKGMYLQRRPAPGAFVCPL